MLVTLSRYSEGLESTSFFSPQREISFEDRKSDSASSGTKVGKQTAMSENYFSHLWDSF